MPSPPAPGTGSLLDFNAPLSAERAQRLVAELAAREPATVIDLGCGWGELLLRLLAALPGANGVGVDSHAADVWRARANAEARGWASGPGSSRGRRVSTPGGPTWC